MLRAIFGGVLVLSSLAGANAGASGKSVLGGLEKIEIRLESSAGDPLSLPQIARVDTGATQTSIDGFGISRFSLSGVPYVKFHTRVGKAEYEVQAPYVMQKQVRSSNGLSELRTFVRLNICVGTTLLPTVVSLSDRHKLRQSVLVGRSLLENRYVVDVSSNYEAGEPHCK